MTDNTQLDGHGNAPPDHGPPGITLKSLIPVLLELKDAVSVESGRYHIKSQVPDDAWTSLQEFVQSVEELDLLMPDADAQGNTVADMTYIQLALNWRGPIHMFPFLKRLRVLNVGESHTLLFLPLLLSQCLESIKIIGLNLDAGIALETYLTLHATETLTRLVIHSSTFFPSTNLVHCCAALEYVEFSSPQYTLIDHYPGSFISHGSLKEWKIVAGQETYAATLTKITMQIVRGFPLLEPIFAHTAWEEFDIQDQAGAILAPTYLEHIMHCPSLKTFSITTTDSGDLYHGSSTNITIHAKNATPPVVAIASWSSLQELHLTDQARLLPITQYLETIASLPVLRCFQLKVGADEYTWFPPTLSISALETCPPLSTISSWNMWQDVERLEVSDLEFNSTADYFDIITARSSLKMFSIRTQDYRICDGTAKSEDTYQTYLLTLHPHSVATLPLPHVEIHQLTIDLASSQSDDPTQLIRSISSKTAHCLRKMIFHSGILQPVDRVLFANSWSQLLELELPMNPTYTTANASNNVSLASLKNMAQQCPNLASFQGLVAPPSSTVKFGPPGGFESCLLSHPLRKLTIGSLPSITNARKRKGLAASSILTPTSVPFIGSIVAGEVARYILALFPEVDICPVAGFGQDSWGTVNEMVQLFRSMLRDFPRPSAARLDGTDDAIHTEDSRG